MTSKIKVDNINKVSDDSNIIKKCGTTITLGASGDSIALASGASQTGFGRTGTVDWDTTPKTATFTAVSGDGFFCNTTGGVFTCNLPAGSSGAIVSLADYAGTWQTNNLTVSPNGSDKIGGTNSSLTLNTEGQSVTFVFVDSTQGWVNVQDSTSNERPPAFVTATGGTITTVCTNFKVHTFTGPGTFCVSCAGNAAGSDTVDYLVIAGGGGAAIDNGGGGGAGGFRESCGGASGCYSTSPLANSCGALPVTAQGYPITVGGGGASPPCTNIAVSGNPSIFSTITSTGGGGSGGDDNFASLPGGSGGGGGGRYGPVNPTGGAGNGNTPPVSPPQGRNGGIGGAPGNTGAGGGGGASAVGTPGQSQPSNNGGNGADGVATSITASSVTRAGGGGGGSGQSAGAGGTGGAGGGGDADTSPGSVAGSPGTTNTGGGGGGGGQSGSGGAGGSGIVVIRYKFQ